MKEPWFKDSIRDLIALGGIPFLILVIIRVSILDKTYLPFQFIIGAIVFLLLMLLFKANLHAGIGFVILFFISLYYSDMQFTILASLVYILLLGSLIYFKKPKKLILKGIIFGAISAGISYYMVKLIF